MWKSKINLEKRRSSYRRNGFIMYSGLFGDLPSAKKSSGAAKDDPSSNEQSIDKGPNASATAGNEEAAGASRTTRNAIVDAVPPGNVNDSTAASSNPKPLFVPQFMPQQMKRPRNKQATMKRPAIRQVLPVSKEIANPPPHPSRMQQEPPNSNDSTSDPNASSLLSAVPSDRVGAILNAERRSMAPSSESVPVQNKPLDENDESLADQLFRPEPPTTAVVVAVEEEPEYLRELHEMAKNDLYDPLVPNDLLHYWEHQRAAKEKERLLCERERALREHEWMRQELDAERRRLQAEGDIDRIVQHRIQHQQGRKVLNIPAWLLAQQREAAAAAAAAGASGEGATVADEESAVAPSNLL
jgi:hypothetical protein